MVTLYLIIFQAEWRIKINATPINIVIALFKWSSSVVVLVFSLFFTLWTCRDCFSGYSSLSASALFYLRHRKSFIFFLLYFFNEMKQVKSSDTLVQVDIYIESIVLLVECIYLKSEWIERDRERGGKNAIKESGLVLCIRLFNFRTFSLILHFKDLKFVHRQG